MEVAMKGKITGAAQLGGTAQLWKMDWDSMAPPGEEVQHEEERSQKVIREEDKSKEAEVKDVEITSFVEGPQSPAGVLFPSSHNPPPDFSPQSQIQTPPPPSQPRVSQPQGFLNIGASSYGDQNGRQERSNEAEEQDLFTNSILESPTPSAEKPFSSSPYHHFHVPSQYQQNHSTPHQPLQVFWRPWEEERSELPLSPISPDPPPRRMIRRAKRSAGDLARRRKRLHTYQNNQAYSFPRTPEPEKSRLESSSWAGGPRRLDWSGMSDIREDPPTPHSGWSSSTGWMYSPSPGPPSPPPWLSSNMAPPSPVYCDGCHSWGNLLTVTVSQARGI